MSRWSPAIRTRLVLLVAVAAGPSLVLSVKRAAEARTTRRAEAELQTMRVARRVASSIGDKLDTEFSVLDGLAAAIRPTPAATLYNDSLLARAVVTRGNPDLVYVLTDARGDVIGRSNTNVRPGQFNLSERDYWRSAMGGAARAIGQPVPLKPSLTVLGITLARPIRDSSGRPIGVIGATIRLSGLSAFVDAKGLTPGSVISLRDSGTIIARSHEAERFVGKPGLANWEERLAKREGVYEAEGLDGVLRLAAFTLVPGAPRWQVSVGFPSEVQLAGVAAARQELLFAILVFAAGLSIAWLIARSITAPVRELVTDANALARGERVHTSLPSAPDLAALATAFNTMSDQVTERTDALRAAEANARLLFRQSPVPMLVADAEQLTVADANDAVCQLLEWPRDELVGQSLEVIRPSEDVARWRASVPTIGDGPTHLGQWRYVTRHGRGLDVELVTARTLIGGRPSFVTVITDVTERLAAERALAEGQEELRQAQKMEALGRFAGGIAHDFNNLLTAILGQLEVTLDDLPKDSPVRQELAPVQRSADRMASLTKQILAFGRRQVVQPVPLDLCAVVHEFQPTLARLLHDGVRLAISCGRDGTMLVADRSQVEQVILNLVVNARDAMPSGGTVQISVHEDAIAPDEAERFGRRAGPAVCLRVHDTGQGIEPALQNRVFEPFFTTKPPGKGTGLGLATVYAIVQQNDGVIRLQSAPGRGTTFDVLWPAASAAQGMRATSGPKPAVSVTSAAPRETVLVVDDEEAVRVLEATALSRLGYTVLAAKDGVEAAELAAAHSGPIHLVVTDCVMPRMGGRELAAALRDIRPGTKVLFMSGHTEDEALLAAIAQEQTAFLPKPFTPGTLAARVREVLDG